jgi:flagellar basal-body rod protein FlgB
MSLLDMPVFAALTDKMRWHQNRQGLLAENVANAETPGYRGRDLAAFEFNPTAPSQAGISTATTRPMHFAVGSASGAGTFDARRLNSFEITPEGNGVTLEDEMMKVTTNLVEYQAVTSLYQKSIKILRSALGRTA